LLYIMRRQSFTNDKIEIFKSRFLRHFSKVWRNGARYKAEKIWERANPWPTLMLMLTEEDEKLFQKYFVFLLTR